MSRCCRWPVRRTTGRRPLTIILYKRESLCHCKSKRCVHLRRDWLWTWR
jgi:hypothetical protein